MVVNCVDKDNSNDYWESITHRVDIQKTNHLTCQCFHCNKDKCNIRTVIWKIFKVKVFHGQP